MILAGSIFVSNAKESVTLAWDPIPNPSIAGYRLYYGKSSGHYPHKVDVGNQPSVSLDHLKAETTYYCVVTGYNAGGFEGLPSAELSFTTGPKKGVITLRGASSMTLYEGDTYVEPGATAFDMQGNPVPVTISGTVDPNVAATYILTYKATGSNGNGNGNAAVPITRSVVVKPRPFHGWLETHFSPDELNDPYLNEALWGTLSDPDGDNLSNLSEYAFGTDPREMDASLPVQSTLVTDDGQTYLAVTFQRPLAAKDVRYTVQVTDDFTVWRDGSAYKGDTIAPSNEETTQLLRTNDGSMETITVRANEPIIDPSLRLCFLRVHVESD